METKIPNRQGRSTFEFIVTQIEECIEDIKQFFDEIAANKLYTKEFYEYSLQLLKERPDIDLKKLALCDIAYSVVFFGMSIWDKNAFLKLYLNHYNPTFLKYISYYLSLKPHKDYEGYHSWDLFKRKELSYLLKSLEFDLAEEGREGVVSPNLDRHNKYLENDYPLLFAKKPFKYYGGHQFKLGHYFRHLYQTLTFINEQDVFCYTEKYEYAKILRAQLSTPEQYILFFNSLSKAGRNWELNYVSVGNSFSNANSYLITKYNMIKNLPDLNFIDQIRIDHFYPFVEFEFESEPKERCFISKLFN